jgi:hypothetical protein
MPLIEHNSGLRDIRPDLRERLRQAVARHQSLLTQTSEAAADVDMLQRMIEREDQRLNVRQALAAPQKPTEELADFMFKAIRMRPQSKEDLRHSVTGAGYDVDGRSIHATTVNLLRRGKIVEISKGVFASADSDLVKSALKAPAH